MGTGGKPKSRRRRGLPSSSPSAPRTRNRVGSATLPCLLATKPHTIYGVIHASGGYTAWSDKHPVYASVSGPGSNAGNVDDYCSPEINSSVIAFPGVTTPTGLSCSSVPDPSNTGSWTDSFDNIKCYDTLKVNAVLNWISGKNHLCTGKAPVPTLFGMNLQAVSLGQKLIEKTLPAESRFGGYTDAPGTPTDQMRAEIEFVDASIGKMVSALKAQGLLDSTLIIVTAKHGQSPVDPKRFHELGNGITTTPADVTASLLPLSESPLNPSGIGPTQDDISLLWLANSKDTLSAVGIPESNAADAVVLFRLPHYVRQDSFQSGVEGKMILCAPIHLRIDGGCASKNARELRI